MVNQFGIKKIDLQVCILIQSAILQINCKFTSLKYIGWTDVPLSEQGISEAQFAGQQLKKEGFEFDIVYTSVLSRAIKTTFLCLEQLGTLWLPVVRILFLYLFYYSFFIIVFLLFVS
jgi:bisphosphoglycerate-dependent phosphoglycerate mutase family 1